MRPERDLEVAVQICAAGFINFIFGLYHIFLATILFLLLFSSSALYIAFKQIQEGKIKKEEKKNGVNVIIPKREESL